MTRHIFDTVARRALLSATAPTLAAAAASAQAAPHVRVGRIALSFNAVTAAVVEALLAELEQRPI